MELELFEAADNNDFIIFLGAGSLFKRARNMEKFVKQKLITS